MKRIYRTISGMRNAGYLFLMVLLCIVLSIATTGCSKNKTETVVEEKKPLVEDMSWGPVKLTITASPAEVRYDSDILLTIRIESAPNIEVSTPDLSDRLQGFLLSGEYGGEPFTQDGVTIIEKHARMTPVLANEYRLAPMAIIYKDKSKIPAFENWFATRPIVFHAAPSLKTDSSNNIRDNINPVWIYPPFKTVSFWFVLVILAIGFCFLAWKFIRKLHREAQLRKLSPKERALKELEFLLAKHLPEKNKIKEFYLELTMIVRSYIERAHDIHAPEQTTEEFLFAVSHDARFSKTVVETLKHFLEAADLVKFAAYRPDGHAIQSATETARTYIDSDDKERKNNV